MFIFSVISNNVRGIRDSNKRRATFDHCRRRAKIVLLQETHSCTKDETVWTSEWGGKIYFSHGTEMSKGVCILVPKNFEWLVQTVKTDEGGRWVRCDFAKNEIIVTVFNIYAPNKDTPEFYAELGRELHDCSEHKIIMGDFNLTLEKLDRLGSTTNNNKARAVLANLMQDFNLEDSWRIRNPTEIQFSWFKGVQNTSNFKASRIDYILISRGIDQMVEQCLYITGFQTDHRALVTTFQIVDTDRGVGYWKFNTQMLQNDEFMKYITQELEKDIQAANTSNSNPHKKWELLKTQFRKHAQKFARINANDEKLILGQLCEIIQGYQERMPLNKHESEIYERTLQDFEQKMFKRVEGIMFRSRAKWQLEGEKSTKYFFNLEKARYNAKTCFKIFDKNNILTDKSDQILAIQAEFYQNLYSKDQDVKFQLENKTGKTIRIDLVPSQQLTFQEVTTAMKQLKNEKTPGDDGIPTEVYKKLWTQMGPMLYDAIIYSYEQNILHKTARSGVLNLIPKPNKDSRKIENLRPITLLNVDYKILEKAMANRILAPLKEIIHSDQRGFLPGRQISVNIRKLLDVIEHCATHEKAGIIMSCDYNKCFDRVSFDSISGSLKYHGFDQITIKWSEILYTQFSLKVQNNGYFSQPISKEKGVHQGGPCSSIYFLAIAEILAQNIRGNPNIKGIPIHDIINVLNQFADDMDTLSEDDEGSIKAIINEICLFYHHTGFKISYDKTTLYRISSLRHACAQMYSLTQFKWSNTTIKVLGIEVCNDQTQIASINYDQYINKIRSIFNTWKKRSLTLIGKVLIVNTLVASIFVYKMAVIPKLTRKYIKTIKNYISNFIWDGKRPKILLRMLQLNKDDGGLGLINLSAKDDAVKCNWVKILQEEPEYKQMVNATLAPSLGELIWCCTLDFKVIDFLGVPSLFWNDVLKAWSHYVSKFELKVENQIIWCNCYISVQNKPIMWKKCFESGLIYVHQLCENNSVSNYDSLRNRYSITIMQYNSLITAIPKHWLEHLTEQNLVFPLQPHIYHLAKYEANLCGKVYKKLQQDVTFNQNKALKWSMEVGCMIDSKDLNKKVKNMYLITNVPKLRSFQYRVLARAIVTNVQLEKWKILQSRTCSFCDIADETLIHLMYECNYVQEFWKTLSDYVSNRFKCKNITLSYEAIIFNEFVENPKHVINAIGLVAKQYIYRQRCIKKDLNMVEFIRMLWKIQNIECYNAKIQGNMHKHEKKWLNCMDKAPK